MCDSYLVILRDLMGAPLFDESFVYMCDCQVYIKNDPHSFVWISIFY
jgi:hypothetical protein